MDYNKFSFLECVRLGNLRLAHYIIRTVIANTWYYEKKAGITNLWFTSCVKGSLKTWLAYKRNSFRWHIDDKSVSRGGSELPPVPPDKLLPRYLVDEAECRRLRRQEIWIQDYPLVYKERYHKVRQDVPCCRCKYISPFSLAILLACSVPSEFLTLANQEEGLHLAAFFFFSRFVYWCTSAVT